MSSTVDNRIVEMQFNNERFERNVSTSISTLDKLKAALNFDTASKNITSIEKGFDKLNLSGIGSAVDVIASRFSSLGVIATTILQDIGHMAFQAGQRILGMINSMTFGQIISGWDKYADKTTSVQTIMSATGQTWEKDADTLVQLEALMEQGFDPKQANNYLNAWKEVNSGVTSVWQASYKLGISTREFQDITKNFGEIAALKYAGSQMDYVNSQMEKLNWFTDETSYNFTDMVSNIGKFTANNIPLSEAVTSMQGIATWAAKSGQNATTASRVMYNLAQSIGAGSVKLMDWRSVETANMATAEFKEEAIKAAAANGKLRTSVDRTGKTIYRTTSGMQVTVENFAQTLSTGWFDKNTLLATLDKYGAFTNKLYEFSEASGLTATEILQLIDAEKKGEITQEKYNQIMADTGLTMDELKSALTELGSKENEFGRKAFEASQEAKTFQEAVDSVKEAASTKWMHIFENIFGDYEKAKERWTAFAEFLYDTFITPLEKIEDLSEILGEVNAVDRIALGFSTLFSIFKGDGEETIGILDSIAEGFKFVFPPIENLKNVVGLAITKFIQFASVLRGKIKFNAIKEAAKGFATILQFLINSISNIWQATEPLRTALSGLVSAFLHVGETVLRAAKYIDTTGVKTTLLQTICEKLAKIVNKVSAAFNKLKTVDVVNTFKSLSSTLNTIKQSFINIWDATEPLRKSLQGLGEAIGGLFQKLREASKGFKLTELSGDGLRAICEKIAPIIDKVSEAINSITVEDIEKLFTDISSVVNDVSSAFSGFIEQAKQFSIWNFVIKIANGIFNAFSHLKDFLSGFSWGKILKGLVIGAGAAFLLYKAYILKWLLSPLMKLNEWLHEIEDVTWALNLKNLTAALRNVAIAIGILAAALLILSYVDYEKAIIGLGLIGTILGVLYVALSKMKFTNFSSILKLSVISGTLLVLASAFLVFSVSLIILAGAIALFALVAKMDSAWKGLGLMAVSLGILIIALGFLSSMSPMVIVGAAALLILASALIVLSVAIGIFALVAKMKSAWKGVGLMAASLGVLVIALFALSKISIKAIAGAAALLILASALIVLSIAMAIFAKVAEMDSVWQGVGLMAASLGILIIALGFLSSMSPMIIVGAASILILSAALAVLAGVMAAFAFIAGMDNAWQGLGLMAVMLGVLVLALLALAPAALGVIGAAGALLLVAGACLVLAVAIGIVSIVLPLLGTGLQVLAEGVSAGLAALGEGIASFGIGVAALIDSVSLSIATGVQAIITSVGEGIGAAVSAIGTGLGEGISAIGSGIGSALMSISVGILATFMALGAGVAALGSGIAIAISAIGQGLGEGISAVGEGIGSAVSAISEGVLAAFTALGEGIAALGAGIGEAAASIGSGAGEGIAAAGEGIGTAIEGISSGIATGLESISSGITTLGEGIAEAISSIASSVSGGLEELGAGISGFGDGVGALVESVLGSVAAGIQEVVSSVGKGIAEGISAVSDSISGLGTGIGDVSIGLTSFGDAVRSLEGIKWVSTGAGIVSFIKDLKKVNTTGVDTAFSDASSSIIKVCETMVSSVSSTLEEALSSTQSSGVKLVEKFANGINSRVSIAKRAGNSVGSSAISGMSASSGGGYTIGQNAAIGFINGFLSKELEAKLAAERIADTMIKAAKKKFQEESPSKVFYRIGEYGTQGLINGLLSLEGSVEDAGEGISLAAISSVADSMSAISDLIDENPDFCPTIRPVLDSTSFKSELSNVNSAFMTDTSNWRKSYLDVQSDIQNGLLNSASANVNAEQEYKTLTQFTPQSAAEFVEIGNKIIGYLRDGHDLYFDDGVFAGRINRRLGSSI